MTIVAIHQPNYIPWIGYFDKMSYADIFVFLDSVEYSRNSVINRNRVRNMQGWSWLTIPIRKEDTSKSICDVRFANDVWWAKHWKSLVGSYSKSVDFQNYAHYFKQLYDEKRYTCIADLNIDIIKYIASSFGILPKFVRSSEMHIDPSLHKNELLVEILTKLNATTYVAGSGCKDYMNNVLFQDKGIDVIHNEFQPFEYKQRWPGFEPYMSAIDLLFNEGEMSKRHFMK